MQDVVPQVAPYAGQAMAHDITNYQSLFLQDVPLIDVRAPVEFSKGAFPHATNLPLMNDAEREKVGTCYKLHGNGAAIELGHHLVQGQTKTERIAAWAHFARQHPGGALYCFRGGLRSAISQEWLRVEAGIELPRVAGGYKAMRTFLLDTLDAAIRECQYVVIGGMTGCGKTELLREIPDAIDLEAHANHRGSSFGKRPTAQPSQIDFENALAIDLLKRRARGSDAFVLEDESRLIGACCLPLPLRQGMQRFPLVWLKDTAQNRVERILQDYVVDLVAEYESVHGSDGGFELFANRLRESLKNISKRLGGARYAQLAKTMDEALHEQLRSGNVDSHRAWITALLAEYYDPMYHSQREAKADRIVFEGSHDEVLDYLSEHWPLASSRTPVTAL